MMTIADIANHRLLNQQIAETRLKKPHEIVGYLGAMQAQVYAMAKWAIGLRIPGLHDADVEKAFNDGAILRTHLMRPTWHFVTPADIRWMLALTAPRVIAVSAYYFRKMELDSSVFKRSNDTLAKALQGGKHLTRVSLKSALDRAKITADGLRLGYLLMRAELDGIICSGPRQRKQFTYALLDERVPPSGTFHREEALAELTRRYFASRGPATLHDFVWWSGLSIKDARAGMAMLNPKFVHDVFDEQEYVFARMGTGNNNPGSRSGKRQTTFLLPDYDEYGISYKNRSALFPKHASKAGNKDTSPPGFPPNAAYHMIVIDGVIAGTWQRVEKNKRVIIETAFFTLLNNLKRQAVVNAVNRYCSFIGQVPCDGRGLKSG